MALYSAMVLDSVNICRSHLPICSFQNAAEIRERRKNEARCKEKLKGKQVKRKAGGTDTEDIDRLALNFIIYLYPFKFLKWLKPC